MKLNAAQRDLLADLWQSEYATMVGYAAKQLRDLDAAYTVVGDVFCKAASALARGHTVDHPRGWLWQILRNRIVDEARVRQRWAQLAPGGVWSILESGENESLIAEDARLAAIENELGAWLNRLPDRQRDALVLRFWYGLDGRELGQAFDVNTAAAKALLHRGKENLRDIMSAVN